MAAPMPQMLTANRLKDGDVLYWKSGAWVESLKDGEVFREEAWLAANSPAAEAEGTAGAHATPTRLIALCLFVGFGFRVGEI